MGIFVISTCLDDRRVAWYSSYVQGYPGPAVSISVRKRSREIVLSRFFVACRMCFLLIEDGYAVA